VDKVAQAGEKLDALGAGSERDAYERLFFQMIGARDQVAEAVRRLPLETGDLYEEDRHRLEDAVAALDRILAHWDRQPQS
jgi:hypothetical protein